MTRTRLYGRLFVGSVTRAGISADSDRAKALWATVREIAGSPEIPAAADLLVIIPPAKHTYVRRVRAFNVWVHFHATGERVVFTHVVTTPPVPASPFHDD